MNYALWGTVKEMQRCCSGPVILKCMKIHVLKIHVLKKSHNSLHNDLTPPNIYIYQQKLPENNYTAFHALLNPSPLVYSYLYPGIIPEFLQSKSIYNCIFSLYFDILKHILDRMKIPADPLIGQYVNTCVKSCSFPIRNN